MNQGQDYYLALRFPRPILLRSTLLFTFEEPHKHNVADSIQEWKSVNPTQDLLEVNARACQGITDMRVVTQPHPHALACVDFTWIGHEDAILCFKVSMRVCERV